MRQLLANGTTCALVFGSHFPVAQEILFREAQDSGLRITSGLIVSDRAVGRGWRLAPAKSADVVVLRPPAGSTSKPS
ncbi:MAG: hypothetical protein ACYC91_14355 [Solirubrobacteraceae bacterium]